METNQIYCECCIDTMSRMPDDFLDATVTSPPYGPIRMYKGFSWDYKAVASELWRVTKPGACVVWVVGDNNINGSEQLVPFEQALYFKSLGFCVETMIYHKHSSAYPGVKRYCQMFEYMFVFSKGLPKVFNPLTEKKKIYSATKLCPANLEAKGWHNSQTYACRSRAFTTSTNSDGKNSG